MSGALTGMDLETTPLQGVAVLRPKIFGDSRGFFLESWNRKAFADLGIRQDFVQDNHSRSMRGVLRGLHYQLEHPQGKLVRVVTGAVCRAPRQFFLGVEKRGQCSLSPRVMSLYTWIPFKWALRAHHLELEMSLVFSQISDKKL